MLCFALIDRATFGRKRSGFSYMLTAPGAIFRLQSENRVNSAPKCRYRSYEIGADPKMGTYLLTMEKIVMKEMKKKMTPPAHREITKTPEKQPGSASRHPKPRGGRQTRQTDRERERWGKRHGEIHRKR